MQNRAAFLWTFSRAAISFWRYGSQAALAYSSFGRTRALYAVTLTSLGQLHKFLLIMPSTPLALPAMDVICFDHFKSSVMVTPRYRKRS